MKEIIEFLQSEMERVTAYSWFHLIFLFLTFVLAAVILVFFRNKSKKFYKITLLFIWLVMFLFEIYKQFVYIFVIRNGEVIVDYNWAAFPFQFCSLPIYVFPVLLLLKEGRVKNVFVHFTVTYILFAGILVMLTPGECLNTFIGINLQTMIHHMLQFLGSLIVYVEYRKELKLKYVLWSMIILIITSLIAVAINEGIYYGYNGQKFINEFFLSRHFPKQLWIIPKIMETIYDSPVELNVDYRILLSMVTCSKGDVTNIAKEVINKVKETYKDKVLESLIRLQSKPAQLQTFDVNYFATDYETSYGQDYRQLGKEVEDAINEY